MATKKEETKSIKKDELNLEELMKTIQSLQSEISSLKQEKEENSNNNNNTQSPIIIRQNEDTTRLVKVTSLLNNTFNLSTQRKGKGRTVTFNKFGESKNIKFTDMQNILENHLKDFEKGYAVLSSKKDYEDLQIEYIYNEVLNFEKMKDIICLKNDNSVNIILNMDEDMQDNMINLIADNIVNHNYSYDYNKIKQLEDNGFEINEVVEMLKKGNNK